VNVDVGLSAKEFNQQKLHFDLRLHQSI